jgi:hypothetical protein
MVSNSLLDSIITVFECQAAHSGKEHFQVLAVMPLQSIKRAIRIKTIRNWRFILSYLSLDLAFFTSVTIEGKYISCKKKKIVIAVCVFILL